MAAPNTTSTVAPNTSQGESSNPEVLFTSLCTTVGDCNLGLSTSMYDHLSCHPHPCRVAAPCHDDDAAGQTSIIIPPLHSSSSSANAATGSYTARDNNRRKPRNLQEFIASQVRQLTPIHSSATAGALKSRRFSFPGVDSAPPAVAAGSTVVHEHNRMPASVPGSLQKQPQSSRRITLTLR